MPKKRILIIDDELDFVKMLQVRLQVEGYEVLVAEDGIKGLQIARKEKPDLIILDIMMPGLDGHSVCDMLKKSTLTWSIPVIYLTARLSPADEAMAFEKGAKNYITKPYNPEVLLEMIRSAILEGEETKPEGGKILIIDKDLNFLDEIDTRLKQAGYKVLFSPNAADGLKKAREEIPDLILFDILTSHEDSHASLKTLCEDDVLKHTPTFILAPESVLDKVDKKIVHPERFISKPIQYGSLIKTIEKALEMKIRK